jgi:hypothetical protein
MDYSKLGHAYGLSYVPVNQEEPAALALTLRTAHWADMLQLLITRSDIIGYPELEYFSERESVTFIWGAAVPPPVTSGPFGIDGCAQAHVQELDTVLHLPLSPKLVREAAMTLHLLLRAIDMAVVSQIERETASNRRQLLTLQTICARGWPYRHGVFGYVYPPLRRWLYSRGGTSIPEAESAIRDTWASLSKASKRDLRLLEHDFGAVISPDGRFLLTCPPPACDIAMYPDATPNSLDTWSEFSCHNLDSAVQQLSLLAGLATMLQMAESEIEN